MADDGYLDLDAAARFVGIAPGELDKLARAGAVQRENGRFHPLRLVRGYVEYIRTEGDRKEKKPTQLEIGNHLDLTDRSVREILPKLGIDYRASNLSTIRIAYIRDLRETAAGRGGEEQANLTLQRTRQAEADANLKQLELFARAQRLVSIDELEPKLSHWASMARAEVENGTERLIAAIENRHGIEVDRELVDKHLDAAFVVIAGGAPDPDGDAAAGPPPVDASAQSPDAPMAD